MHAFIHQATIDQLLLLFNCQFFFSHSQPNSLKLPTILKYTTKFISPFNKQSHKLHLPILIQQTYLMSKQQLTELLIKDDKPYQQKQQLWFNRYNHVIDVYHNSVNNGKQQMEKMKCQKSVYLFASYLINNYLMNIAMVLVYTFLPVINLVLLIVMSSYSVFVKTQTHKHKRNLQKVEDPFQTFYFYPQMCRQLQKHFTTLNLTVQQIENFKFNETHDKLRQNLVTNEGESGSNLQKKKKVKVPIYDQYFYDSFFLVRKQYYKAMSWSILGVFLIGLDILFYYGVFEDFLLN